MPRGRKPVPLVLLDKPKQHKSNKALQAREDAAVTGCSAKLIPPEELSGGAKIVWNRVIALYKDLPTKILCDLDEDVLTAYCESVAYYQAARRERDKLPIAMRDKRSGAMVQNIFARVMREEQAIYTKLAEQLYLTPAGRARIESASEKSGDAEDPMTAFLSRHGE
jgi:P27 family predicted phage terminase small subunit